jgi:hypothetical protein
LDTHISHDLDLAAATRSRHCVLKSHMQHPPLCGRCPDFPPVVPELFVAAAQFRRVAVARGRCP